jgi:D-inositol-3-phosphate glycosyltransferase
VPARRPAELAGLLRRLLADRALRSSLGAAAAEHVRDRYPWSRIAAETEAVYERLVATARKPAAVADRARS